MRHHSQPRYREWLAGMGKRGGGRGQGQGSQAQQDWGGWEYPSRRATSSPYWQWWHGTWSPRGGRRTVPERYDAVELKPAEPEPASTEGSFLSHIQRALTNAKKQDTRVRKLAEEQQKRRQQFAQYEADVKAKFATQKKNFLADMERLAAEQAAAVEAGQTAAAQVKALVAGKAPTPAAPAITEREAAWKELWASVQDEPRPTGFLQEALSAAGMSEAADSEMQDVLGPSFPQARGLEVVPGAEAFFGTPPGLVRAEGPGYTAVVPRDPYMLSPTHRPPAASPDSRQAATRSLSRPRPHPYADSGEVSGAERLEERLRARREVMASEGGEVKPMTAETGIPPAPPAMSVFGRAMGNKGNLLANAVIEEDDDDLDLPAGPAHPPPDAVT